MDIEADPVNHNKATHSKGELTESDNVPSSPARKTKTAEEDDSKLDLVGTIKRQQEFQQQKSMMSKWGWYMWNKILI